MKKIKLALLVAGSLVAGASTSAFAAEGQGTITFDGELIKETCQITSPLNQSVKLPKVSVKSLTASGDEGGYMPFTINVDCSGAEATDLVGKKIAVHLEPVGKTTDWDPATGNLLNNLTGANDAKNVQIKIYSTTGGKRVHNKIGETGAWVDITAAKKTMDFHYVGGYYATAQTTPGLVNATVMYTLVYQ